MEKSRPKRWQNVGKNFGPTSQQCWQSVGPMSAHHWLDVGTPDISTLGRRCSVDVAPTFLQWLAQRRIAIWRHDKLPYSRTTKVEDCALRDMPHQRGRIPRFSPTPQRSTEIVRKSYLPQLFPSIFSVLNVLMLARARAFAACKIRFSTFLAAYVKACSGFRGACYCSISKPFQSIFIMYPYRNYTLFNRAALKKSTACVTNVSISPQN